MKSTGRKKKPAQIPAKKKKPAQVPAKKKPYSPPTLIVYGNMRKLTVAGASGVSELGAMINPNRMI